MKTETQLSMAENRRQVNLLAYIVGGAIAWLAGVLLIRLAGPIFFVEGSSWLVGLYLLTIPGGWFLVKAIALAGKLNGINLVMAVVIMNFTASFMDGAAIAWFPSLYGLPTAAHLLAAAYLLWFVAISLCASFLIARNESLSASTT